MTDPWASTGTDLDEIAVIHFDGDTVEVEHAPRQTTRRIGGAVTGSGLRTQTDTDRLRVGWLSAFVASLLGTVLLAGPLVWAARDVAAPPAVLSAESLVVITTDTELAPLHNSTVSKRALISFVGDEVQAVAFTLSSIDGDVVSERIDGLGPEFDFLTDGGDQALALDTRKLKNGPYELFVTATTLDGEPIHTAAAFEVSNR